MDYTQADLKELHAAYSRGIPIVILRDPTLSPKAKLVLTVLIQTYRRVEKWVCASTIRQKEIAEACGLSRSSVKNALRELCDRGLIRWHRPEFGGVTEYFFTLPFSEEEWV